MKFILLIFSLNLFAAEVGFKGNSFSVGGINLSVQKNVDITSDNQAVTVDSNGNAALLITSDSAVALDRSFVLSPGKIPGQEVSIMCFITGINAAQIDDESTVPGAGTMKLAGNWICAKRWDSLKVQWTGNHWVERGRVSQ